MAKRVDAEHDTNETRMIGEADFAKLLKKLDAADSRLNEAKGDMGTAIEQAIAKHNVHKDALRIIRKYRRKDPAAATEFIAHLDHMWVLAGLPGSEDDLVEPKTSERVERLKTKPKLVPQPEAPPAA